MNCFKKNRLAMFLLLFTGGTTFAAEYSKTKTCATAHVIEGDTCSNVKVQFEFSQCPESPDPKVVEHVVCTDKTITARTTVFDVRYEAKFKKNDDGWGAITWAPLGEVQTLKKKGTGERRHAATTKPAAMPIAAREESAPLKTETPATREPTQTAASVANDIAQSTKVSGFFDFRFSSYKSDSHDQYGKNGFLLEDGAVYFNYAKDKFSVIVDLPFSRDTSTPDQANLVFAKTKAQLHARYNIFEGFTVGFGQFDTFYGVEVNDSKDRVFGNTGIVYNQTLPVVHDGAYAEYAWSGVTGRFMVANPADHNNRGTTDGDSHQEYGATLGYSNEHFRGQAGHLMRAQRNRNGKSDTRAFTDLIVGTTWGPFDLDLEYNMLRNPQKNTLTTDLTDREDDGNAFLALATYQPIEKLKIGARYEIVNKDPIGGTLTTGARYNKVSSIAGNATYTISNNLWGRIEYVSTNSDRDDKTNDVYNDQRFDVGAIVLF